jgi:hypothetical protein
MRYLLFTDESLSLFDTLPRQRMHLFHPCSDLLVITMLNILLYLQPLLLEDSQYFFRSCSHHSGEIQIFLKRVRVIDPGISLSPSPENQMNLVIFELFEGASVTGLAGDDVLELVGFVADWAEAGLEGWVGRGVHL